MVLARRASWAVALAVLASASTGALAQGGITRVAPGTPQQPGAAPQAPGYPAAQAPAYPALPAPNLGMPPPRPMPLPGQPLGSAGVPSQLPPNLQVPIVDDALNRIAPLTVQEVLELRQELLRRRQAVQQALEPLAVPVRRAVTLDLSPTAPPEVVRVAPGQGTIIAFYDAAGRPWPFKVSDGYAPDFLDVSSFGTASLSIGLKRPLVGRTNIAVLLDGLDTPVVLSVLPASEQADVALEVQVPRYVPGLPAPVNAAQHMASLNAAELMDYLMGTPPKSARALTSTSAVVKAWQTSSNKMIVRTNALVAAPAWTRRQSSGTGVTVYEMSLSPVVTVAVDGALSLVRLDGFAATTANTR